MSMIQLLDESTINQIAAGEVVERPSAVVKELIENAMDAGATAITAEIKDGGLSLIRITDNGAGIAREDIPLAFFRHATSKIRSAEDLLTVTSLGFRGEALSSIAAVSQVELITKTPSSLNGYRYMIEGGEEKSIEEIGCPQGTTILVRNLFFNTPARRKFLKSPVTETGYVSDLMERLMVSHPGVSFKFIVNNQVKLQSSGNNNSKDILYHVYGRDISKELIPVEYRSCDLTITGYIGKPLITRGNRNFENYFINGRFIKSNIITKAIEEGYKPFLMQHKYPFTSLYYEIDPSQIDVNVHPQKLEVRLKSGEEIFQITQKLIRDSLSGKEMIPKVTLVKQEEIKKSKERNFPEPFEENRIKQLEALKQLAPEHVVSRSVSNEDKSDQNCIPASLNPTSQVNEKPDPDNLVNKKPDTDNLVGKQPDLGNLVNEKPDTDNLVNKKITKFPKEEPIPNDLPINKLPTESNHAEVLREDNNYGNTNITDVKQSNNSEQINLFSEGEIEGNAPFLSKKALEEHRVIGQVFSTYWLVEYKKELYIIDQHAAHEKVLYERIISAATNKSYESQLLLPPIVLTLTLREQEVLQKYEDTLTKLGYEFEHFGGNEYSVRAVPSNLYGLSEKELILEFLDELADEIVVGALQSNSILEKTASLSCKAAVKANHSFSHEEASALIKELLTLENPYHCPHGRPVIISMSQYELERKFKRIL